MHVSLITCPFGNDLGSLNLTENAASDDGNCSVIQINPDGEQLALFRTIEPGSTVLLMAPGATPDKQTIATARRLLEPAYYAAVLGSTNFNGGEQFARLVEMETEYQHREISHKENLPMDASCAVFTYDAFMLVCRSGSVCGSDSIHELACALAAMGHEVGFDISLHANCEPPRSWKDLAGAYFNQGTQLARRLAGVGGMDLEKKPWQPSAAWEAILVLAALGFFGVGFFHDTPGNLIRAAICVLLLYPVNRGFLKHISESAPELMYKALMLCLLRAPLRTAGLLKSAVMRLLSP